MRYWWGRASFIAILALAGCAAGWSNGTTHRELLQPWVDVTGGQMNLSSGAFNTDYIMLRRPTAISVRGNDLYLVDAGLRRIFRYDRMQQTLTPFAANIPFEAGMSIYAADDQTVYIALPSSGKVVHFTWEGVLLSSMSSPGNLARPVSLAVDARRGRVLVVDGLYNHIVVFSHAGEVLSIIKPPQMQSISAIATGVDGIYAIDRLARRIAVLGWNGVFRFAFAADSVSEPGSIAVSRDKLVFVGDNFDNSVRVYDLRGRRDAIMVGRIGGAGATDSYNGIGGLAAEEDMLYVADSLNGRIQTLQIDLSVINTGK